MHEQVRDERGEDGDRPPGRSLGEPASRAGMNASAAVSHAVLRSVGQQLANDVDREEDAQQPHHDARHVEDRFAVAQQGSRSGAQGRRLPPAYTPAACA